MPTNDKSSDNKLKIGELFAGVGGFSLGFEAAGWETAWQVEINPIKRAVLSDRFPHARQFEDVRKVSAKELCPVDCIAGGFPCTDISNMGHRKKGGIQGLKGERSGLFSEFIRIAREIQPRWLVLENVPALLHSNDCQDIEKVISDIADCNYVGFARVLDAQYFGVAQKRRRFFLVCGLGEMPPFDLLADAAPMEALPCSFGKVEQPWRQADRWPGHTQTATNARGRINLGSELLVAEEDGWHQMVERERASAETGIPSGLDDWNWAEAHAAGDAICPQIAEWIALKLNKA